MFIFIHIYCNSQLNIGYPAFKFVSSSIQGCSVSVPFTLSIPAFNVSAVGFVVWQFLFSPYPCDTDIDNVFLESGLILTPAFALGAHEVLLQLAQINLGVSCVIKEFSTSYLDNHSLFELKQENPIPERAMGYCYSKNLPFSPAMKKFIKFLDTTS